MTRPDDPDSHLDQSEGLHPSEATDEDELAVDPLEVGVEPPERWSGADRYGTTPAEEHEDRALDSRLAEERPDVLVADTSARPVADTPVDQLDESVDHEYADGEPAAGQNRVIAGEEVEASGEPAVRDEGRTVTTPDTPAADEAVVVRDEDSV